MLCQFQHISGEDPIGDYAHPARWCGTDHFRITDVEVEGEHDGDQEQPTNTIAPSHCTRHSLSWSFDLSAFRSKRSVFCGCLEARVQITYSCVRCHRTLQELLECEAIRSERQRTSKRQQSSLHPQYRSDSRVGPACGNFAGLTKDESCRIHWCSSPEHCSDDNISDQMACTSNKLDPLQDSSRVNICQNRNDHESDSNKVDVPAFGGVIGMEQSGNPEDLRGSVIR